MAGQMRFGIYGLGSVAVSALVLLNAYHSRKHFYSICIYLATSKAAMMVLGNMAFVVFLLFAQMWKKIFFGTLRDVEVEHLTDKIWSTVMDTLLIMTIFRDEFTARFIALFVFLLFVKTFHWLAQDRVDYLQQTPQVTSLSHIRIITLMLVLFAFDSSFVYYSAINTFIHSKGPSMMILFGFEYLLLCFSLFVICSKYILNVIDMRREGRWESKGTYVLYVEFFGDAMRLIVYMAFFAMILTYFGVPLHIIRQLYYTFISFRRRVAEVLRYRRATQNMNARFPDATPSELSAAGDTCIVCRDDMREGKKLPCGHILHMHCLRSWLERQQLCPICRAPVLQEEWNATTNANVNFNANPNQRQQQQQQEQAPPVNAYGNQPPIHRANSRTTSGVGASTSTTSNTSTSTSDANVNIAGALVQIQAMQQQLLVMNQQMHTFYSYLNKLQDQLQQQANNNSINSNSNLTSVTFTSTQNKDSKLEQKDISQYQYGDDEEELLQKALAESAREMEHSPSASLSSSLSSSTTIPSMPSSTSISSPSSPVPSGKEDTLKLSSSGDSEQDNIRKRRLLRFSQQLDS